MQETIHKATATDAFIEHEALGINHPDARARPVSPFDRSTGVIFPPVAIAAIIGVSDFTFTFFNEGGPNNLKPGRATTQTAF
jgi:hypothetical protein